MHTSVKSYNRQHPHESAPRSLGKDRYLLDLHIYNGLKSFLIWKARKKYTTFLHHHKK